MTWLSVDLPEPFGPMIACTSPGFTVSVSPCRISLSSTRTFRSLTSSNAVVLFPCGLKRPNENRKKEPGKEAQCSTTGSQFAEFGYISPSHQAADQGRKCSSDRNKQKDRKWRKPDEHEDVAEHWLSDAALQRDRDQLLRFYRKLHRQLLQHVLHEAVDHEANRFFLAEAALDAIKQHVLGNLRRRRFVLERRRRILRLDIGH